MKYFRNNNSVYDLEKEIELLKSQAIHNINEKCDYMYDDFYNEEDLTPTQIEEKRKNNINSLIVEKGKNENGFYIFVDCEDMDECCVGKNYGKVIIYGETIEKLCDEFVVEYNAGDKIDHLTYYSKDRMNFIWEGKEDRILAIYGAIWTEKGLIYVAKMNEKGELELL